MFSTPHLENPSKDFFDKLRTVIKKHAERLQKNAGFGEYTSCLHESFIKGKQASPTAKKLLQDFSFIFRAYCFKEQFQLPNINTQAKALKIFKAIFGTTNKKSHIAKLKKFGFKTDTYVTPVGTKFYRVMDDLDNPTGKGIYLINPNGGNIIIQVPHTYFDEYTLVLALMAMIQSYKSSGHFADNIAMIMISNTLRNSNGCKKKGGACDVAHCSEETWFSLITRAFLDANPNKASVFQLHGFFKEKRLRTKLKRRNAYVILSNGLPRDNGIVGLGKSTKLSNLLNRHFSVSADNFIAYTFGATKYNAQHLGATTNVIGQIVNNISRNQIIKSNRYYGSKSLNNADIVMQEVKTFKPPEHTFIHCEMCLSLRINLVKSPFRCSKFYRCLGDSIV